MTQAENLKHESNLEALSHYDIDTLLEAFIHSYNNHNGLIDQISADLQRVAQERDGYKRQANAQNKELSDLKNENEFCRDIALKAENISCEKLAVDQELLNARQQIKALQQTIREMKQLGDPKRLKEQVNRLKQKGTDKEKRIKTLTAGNQDLKKALSKKDTQLIKATDKIRNLQTQLAHNTGSGLYHNGKHHLIIWPEITKMEDENGHVFKSRSLLYLHQSGRGGLMTYNPNTEQANLCSAPSGGLRPSDDLKQFAQNWLYKVNILQDGTVKEEDMIPVNHNYHEQNPESI